MFRYLPLMPLIFVVSSAVADVAQNSPTKSLLTAARERLSHKVEYDASYFSIPYPNGDVPENLGVCSDVVVRAYRGIGIDLQKMVHEDMSANFSLYPSRRIWGLSRPDPNIDHRRVPNLQTFFERYGQSLSLSSNGFDYLPGDIVTWHISGEGPHIGIVSDARSRDGLRPMIIHNFGDGPELEDMIFDYDITGHYRYRSG